MKMPVMNTVVPISRLENPRTRARKIGVRYVAPYSPTPITTLNMQAMVKVGRRNGDSRSTGISE